MRKHRPSDNSGINNAKEREREREKHICASPLEPELPHHTHTQRLTHTQQIVAAALHTDVQQLEADRQHSCAL